MRYCISDRKDSAYWLENKMQIHNLKSYKVTWLGGSALVWSERILIVNLIFWL